MSSAAATQPVRDHHDADAADREPHGRRRHYAAFFGLESPPDGYGLVVGNCQAESLRVVLHSEDRPTVRVPPVHELDAAAVPRLHDLLSVATFLVAQPVREDYHGLRLGTSQLIASLPRGAKTATFTPVRYGGLYPFQATLHVPGVEEVPPLVAYHDVRTLAAAAGLPVEQRLRPEVVRAVAEEQLAVLRLREARTDVVVSHLVRPIAAHMRTVNHPGNDIWMPLADRVIDVLGLPGEPSDPGRPLLDAVHAPLESWAVETWGSLDAPRDHWLVGGDPLDPQEVRVAHLAWYARNPRFVAGAVDRLAGLLEHWRRA